MSILKLENIYFEYEKDTPILKDVSFSVEKGEWISIIGHNGSGKSTLAKLIIGLLEKKSGNIYIDDQELNVDTLYDLRKKVGIIFQNPDNQFVGTTVIDDVAFGMENLCIPKEEMFKRIDYYLDKVKMMEFKDSEPHRLSGGQKQRVAVAGILAMKTDIIILDESTSMLDPEGRNDLINTLETIKQEGKTIITITHDMKEALLSDRIIVLKDGCLIKDGSREEVMQDEELLKSSKLELPVSLKMYFTLKEKGYKDEKVLNKLWELTFKK